MGVAKGGTSMMLFFAVAMWMSSLAPGRDHRVNATAITAAVLAERPFFADDEEHFKTAALVVSVTFRESSFRNDVVSSTNDHCLAQIHGRPDLALDVGACLRVAMAMLRSSISTCGSGNALGIYATGSCSSPRGQRISRDRMGLAKRLLEAQP